MKYFLLHSCILAVMICSGNLFAQEAQQRRLSFISLETGNAITAYPIKGFPQLFYSNYHPFITIGTGLTWAEKNKHAWEQSFNLGYIYHRFIQHSIPLYTELFID